MNVPTASTWNDRKTVLSSAPAVVPLSTAYHWRSTAATSVSPPPGPGSGRRPTGLSTCQSRPSVERWMNEFCVEVPHGPDSQKPVPSMKFNGSPSVRCASITVAGLKTSLPATRLVAVAVPVPPSVEPGTPITGALLVAYVPVYVYGSRMTPPANGQT